MSDHFYEIDKLKVLDFDCECRPIAWYGGDFVTKQPTAIAWGWVGKMRVTCAQIGLSFDNRRVLEEEADMLRRFSEAYNEADVVTGHYIRGFDLPMLNAALARLGLPRLGRKLAQDTKTDLVKLHGISKSQENLGAMLKLESPKVGMNTATWGDANMLLPEGLEETRKRVMGDVRQHKELRQRLIDQKLLRAPSVWEPGGYVEGYTP